MLAIAPTRLFLGLLFVGLCSCPAPEPEEPFYPPTEFGPFVVGTAAAAITGPDGVELNVQAWFPSRRGSEFAYEYDGLFSGIALDAAVPNCDEVRPVLMFSHGNTGVRYQSLYLTEFLASHGFVVAAPGHTDNTFLDFEQDQVPAVALRRPGDISAAFDWVAGLELIEGCVDADAGYAIAGHSFGGYTAIAAAGAVLDIANLQTICGDNTGWLCGIPELWYADNPGVDSVDLSDERIWATVPMAPAGRETFGAALSGVTVPALILGGDQDTATPWDVQVKPMFDGMSQTPRYLAQLVGGSHYSFSDACNIVPSETFCAGDIDLGEAQALVNQMTLSFLLTQQGDTRYQEFMQPDDARIVWEASE